MSSLHPFQSTLVRAAELVAKGRIEDAGDALESVLAALPKVTSVDLIRRFASLCRQCGCDGAQEAALRSLLAQTLSDEDRFSALSEFVDLLHRQRSSPGLQPHHETSLTQRCVETISDALGVGVADKVEWANLIRGRAACYLDVARNGEQQVIDLGLRDIDTYLEWLVSGRGVPAHWVVDTQVALARFDRVELEYLSGNYDPKALTTQLLESIEALEQKNSPAYMTKRAYSILELLLSRTP